MRRVATIAVVAALMVGVVTAIHWSARRRPNVVLVSIDTLRYDHLGAYGYARATSPHIDALARDSVVFDQAIAHAPSTLPSHASILTSLLPEHHGASVSRQTALPEQVLTLAEILREKGYATASFNGGIQLDPVYGIAQGFDVYESVRPKGEGPGALRAPEDRLLHMVGRALDWVEQVRERPFFVFLHSYEVHHPYTPRDEFWVPTQADYQGVVQREVSVEFLMAAIRGEVQLNEHDRQRVVDAYDAEIRSADAAVGELIEQLKSRGLLDDTVLVLTSDHGEEFSEHGWIGWHSHSLYDELLRVPLLIRIPGGKGGGRRVPQQVRGIDIAPTVLDLLGLEIPSAFEGRSLVDVGPAEDASYPAVSRKDTGPDEHVVSIRTEEWKLYDGRLFHLSEDRGESRDVYASEPAVAERLEGLLAAATSEREVRAGTPVSPQQELLDRLRALGYLEADTAPASREGLTGAYYTNADWDGDPIQRRVDPQIDFDWLESPGPLPAPFSMEWTGAIRIARPGLHTFQLESDDGSVLEIGGRVVVDNGGEHPIRTRSGQVELSEGVHAIRIRYFNKLLGGKVRLSWEPPGGSPGTVPREVLIPELTVSASTP